MIEWINVPSDWSRVVNLILCVLVLAGMACNARILVRAPRAWQTLGLAWGAAVITFLYSTIETLIHDSPSPGIRSYVATLALAWGATAMILLHRDHRD